LAQSSQSIELEIFFSVTSSRGELIGGFFGKCVILTIIF
jgi:hypothetical protein